MSAIKIIQALARKTLTKNQGSGIRSIPSAMEAEAKAGEIAAILQQAGMPLQQLDNFIRSEKDLLKFLNIIEASSKPRVIPGTSAEGKAITEKLFGKKGEVVEFPQKRTFKEEIEAMKKSGDLVDEDNMVISDKITNREMFKNSNLNKEPISERFIDYTIQNINKMKPIDAMKEANSVIGRKGPYKDLTPKQSKKILQDTEDHIFERDIPIDPEDMARGGRAGYAVGNQVMPAVDPGMYLDYNTLVNQNEDQRVAQRNMRGMGKSGFQTQQAPMDISKHFSNNDLLRAAVNRGELSSADYNRLGGFDVSKNITGGDNIAGGILNALGSPIYNTAQAIFETTGPKKNIMDMNEDGIASFTSTPTSNQKLSTIPGTVLRNAQGGFGLISDDLKAQYESIINPTVDQDRISEIVEQQKAAGVPDKGLITQLYRPNMADVAGASSGPTGYTNLRKFYNPFEGRSNLPTSLEEFKSRPGNFEAQIGKRVGYSPTEYYPSFYLDEYGPKTQEGYDSMLADLRNFTLDFGDNPYERDLDSYQFYNYARDDEGNPIGKFTNEEARKEYDEKKAFRQSRYNLGKRQLDNYFNNLSKGGRAGYYTGGMVDVEPNLSDIGHGSDALMARTRLVSPDGQATTSTGLNYLLAEDNDNIRVPFKVGGDAGRRAFLKLLATLTGGAAAFKTGILGLGEGAGKKAVTETIKQAAGSGNPPPYFFKLVDKIKTLGDDTMATQDKAIAKKYKDYVMEEDFAGNIEIIKKGDDIAGNKIEDVYMRYTVDEVPLRGKKGSSKVEEYEEFTARPDAEGKMKDVEPGVPDEVVQEGTMFEDNMTEFGKADGGRIDFMGGGLANVLSRLGIKGSSRRFLEKAFGKERFEEMIKNDPDMHRGLLEVVEMFRNRDKEGLKMYMQKFLPHMDDAEIEQFIVGSRPDIEGLTGQLTRLGSGRDYAGKLEMMKKADEVKKLQNFDIKNVTKNAEGGRIGFSGGGIFRAIIAKAAAAKGMKPYEFIKVTSYKSLPREVKMFMSAEDFAQLKSGQKQMYSNYIDMAKTRKNFQQEVEGGKTTPAKPLFESMEKMMDEQSYVPKNVTTDDIAEMELMVKNRFNKGRKDNALGGLQTMLGE